MKVRKKILAFTAIAASIIALATVVLVLVSDNTLKNAGKACDTISITAEYDTAAHKLTASQSIKYTNRTGMPLSAVKFHIYANAYKDGAKNPPVNPSEVPQAYPNGKNFGGITVANLWAGGQKVIPVIGGDDDTVLTVNLGTPLGIRKAAKIDIDYVVQLANIKHRLGWTADTVNLANFYPVPCVFENGEWQTYPYSASGDPFYNDLHNFCVRITAPREYVVAASGTVMKAKKSGDSGGKKTTHLDATAIRDFAAVLSPHFKLVTRMVKKTAVKYYYINDAEPRKSLDTSCKALSTFSDMFTKYPYKQLSVVQTDFLHGGMEYGELVYVSRAFLNPDDGKKPSREDHDRVIIHEIAHQWWYGLVGNNQTRNAWIDEGLAEYSTLLFYDRHPEYNVNHAEYVDNARRNYSAYVKLIRGVGGELDTTMNRDLGAFNSSYEYVFMTYVRGLLLFCDLETILTRAKLTAALSDFAEHTKFGIGTQAKLVACIEHTTKAKVGVFFESYLGGF